MAPSKVNLNRKQPLENVQATVVVGADKLLPSLLPFGPSAVEPGADSTAVAVRRALRGARCKYLVAGISIGAFITTIFIAVIVTLDYNFNTNHLTLQGPGYTRTEGKAGCVIGKAGHEGVKKEGQCPSVLTKGDCQDQCEGDQDCPGEHKCCPTSCGASACTRPRPPKTCDDVVCSSEEQCREVYDYNDSSGVSARCLVKPATPYPEAQCAVGMPLVLLQQQKNGTVSEAICSRGGNVPRCPEGYHCNVSSPNDTLAVCCRNQDRCLLPKDPGPCEAAGTVYYYNSTEGRCMTFIYGACEGNDNRFSSRDHCRAACARHICKLPLVVGKCRAYILSYFYNSETHECEQFLYRGCHGNDNRFSSREDCYNVCSWGDIEHTIFSMKKML